MHTNKVELSGYLGKDAVVSIHNTQVTLATKGSNNTTDWHDLIFKKGIGMELKRGDFVQVLGQLSYHEYFDRAGNKHKRARILVTEYNIIKHAG